jgi:hypothetical protein
VGESRCFAAAWIWGWHAGFRAGHGIWVGVTSFLEGGHFLRVEHAPFAGSEAVEPDGSDADAAKAFDLIAAVVHHQSDLPLNPLEQDDAQTV